jgi:transketolase
MVSSIPHVDAYALTCSEEAEALMTQVLEKFTAERKAGKTPRTTVFFLGRENFPKSYVASARYRLGKAQVVYESAGSFEKIVTLIGGGSLLGQALQAAKSLETRKIGAIVVNPAIINHPDTEVLSGALKKSQGRVVMAEDHQMIGGMNQMLTFALAEKEISFKPRYLAVHEEFGQSAYNAIDLYKKHRLDSEAIVKAALEL